MANFIPDGWLLDNDDGNWNFGGGTSLNTTLGQLEGTGGSSWDTNSWYSWQTIPADYTGDIYYSIALTGMSAGLFDYVKFAGYDVGAPSDDGVVSGTLTSAQWTDFHTMFIFKILGTNWYGTAKNIWVGDTPPPSDDEGLFIGGLAMMGAGK